MRSCEDYEELISARLDGALTDEERAALDAHLAGCPRCRRTAEELARVDAALRSLDGAAPVDLTARVLERIGEERAVPLRRRPRRALWGVAAAAVLALVLVAGSGLSLFPAAGDGTCGTASLAAQDRTAGDDRAAPAEDSASAEPEDEAKTADTAPASAAGEDRRPARQEQRTAVHGADDDLADGGDPAGADDGQTGEIASAAGGGAAPRAANETGDAADGTGRAAASAQIAEGQSAAEPLTEDAAAAALRAWLGEEDAPLTALGTTDDGGAWRFALDGRTFAVSVEDGAVSEEGEGPS